MIINSLLPPSGFKLTFKHDVRTGELEVSVWNSRDRPDIIQTCIGTIVFTQEEINNDTYQKKFIDFFIDRNLIKKKNPDEKTD